jgi:hypothetical protein
VRPRLQVSSWNHEPNRAILFTVLIALPFSFVPEIDTIASVTAVCFLATCTLHLACMYPIECDPRILPRVWHWPCSISSTTEFRTLHILTAQLVSWLLLLCVQTWP